MIQGVRMPYLKFPRNPPTRGLPTVTAEDSRGN
jgi:hypothetical protein